MKVIAATVAQIGASMETRSPPEGGYTLDLLLPFAGRPMAPAPAA